MGAAEHAEDRDAGVLQSAHLGPQRVVVERVVRVVVQGDVSGRLVEVDRRDDDVGHARALREKRENGDKLAAVVVRLVVADKSWNRLDLGSDGHVSADKAAVNDCGAPDETWSQVHFDFALEEPKVDNTMLACTQEAE